MLQTLRHDVYQAKLQIHLEELKYLSFLQNTCFRVTLKTARKASEQGQLPEHDAWRKIILSITKVVWETFFAYVHVMGHLPYQSDWTRSRLADTPLGMPVRAFPESFNWDHSRMRKVLYNVLGSQTEQNTRNWRTCTSFPCPLFPFVLRNEQAATTCSPSQDPLVPMSWLPHNYSLNALRPRA